MSKLLELQADCVDSDNTSETDDLNEDEASDDELWGEFNEFIDEASKVFRRNTEQDHIDVDALRGAYTAVLGEARRFVSIHQEMAKLGETKILSVAQEQKRALLALRFLLEKWNDAAGGSKADNVSGNGVRRLSTPKHAGPNKSDTQRTGPKVSERVQSTRY